MRRGPTFWIVVLAVAAAGAGFYLDHRRLNPPPPAGVTVSEVGDMAPAATFVTVDGAVRRLDAWRGKRVLINFWASWCAPCRREMPVLSARAAQLPPGVVIVGVAEDTADAVRASLAAQPVGYPVLLAESDSPGGSLAFGNTRRVLPYSVLVGADGRILRHQVGVLSPAELDQWLAP